LSLGVLAALYVALGVVDFILMRRYATVDPPEVGEREEGPVPAMGY
jgi:hypothetical protein